MVNLNFYKINIYNIDREIDKKKIGTPLIRLYGINENKISVCLLIENFHPYFYVKKPKDYISADKQKLIEHLTKLLENNRKQPYYVYDIEIVEKINIYNYNPEKEQYLKIILYDPKNVSFLRDIFEKGYLIGNLKFEPQTFESKINFPLRFMVDRDIVGMSWVKVQKGKFRLSKNPISNCQIEAWCSVEDVIPLSTHGEYSKLAPLRILSIDIECSSEKGHFPVPEKDHVIQISNICIEFGADSEPIIQKMFSYKKCADIVGVDVHSFDTEEEMLKEWRQFIIDLDPDIITGYNISMFDLPFLLNRAEVLKIKEFAYLSRLKFVQSKVRHKQTKVKGFMNRDTIDINLEGRIILDMYTYLIREIKLRSYSLNNVSFQFLGEQKEDVHHSLISKLWLQNEYTRRRLAVYCMKDAYLPLKLMDIFLTLINYAEMCRVTSTPLNFILTRGQQIKVSTQLHKKALERG